MTVRKTLFMKSTTNDSENRQNHHSSVAAFTSLPERHPLQSLAERADDNVDHQQHQHRSVIEAVVKRRVNSYTILHPISSSSICAVLDATIFTVKARHSYCACFRALILYIQGS
jgi:hypothetical protein